MTFTDDLKRPNVHGNDIPLTRLTILPHSRDTKVPGTPMRYRSVLPEILQALHRPFACGPIPASCRGLTLAVTRETMKFIEHRGSGIRARCAGG